MRFLRGIGVVNLELTEVESNTRSLRRSKSSRTTVAGIHGSGMLNGKAQVFVRLSAEVDYRRFVHCPASVGWEVVFLVRHVNNHCPLRRIGRRRACSESVVIRTVNRDMVGRICVRAGGNAAAESQNHFRHGLVERYLQVVPAIAVAERHGRGEACFPY